jgi:hypothetical protein
MQVPEQFHSEALYLAQPFVVMDKLPEPFVLLPGKCMNRTPVSYHASLLVLEMNSGVGFQIIDQQNRQFHFLPARLGSVQQVFQKIDIIN